MERSSSETGSHRSDSTTLSEFVNARFSGEIPLLGGSPINGMRDLRQAARGSGVLMNTHLMTAIEGLTTALRNNALGAPIYSYQSNSRRGSSDSPVVMVDNDLGSMQAASALDDDKIKHILSSSSVRTEDLSSYMQLLTVARDGLKKKAAAQELHSARKKAKVSFSPVVDRGEIEKDLEANRGRIDAIKKICRFELPDDTANIDLLNAITHDSYYGGRESNRVLAYIGDIVCKLYASLQIHKMGRPVDQVSAIVSEHQTNIAFHREAVRLGITEHLRVAVNTDPEAKSIASNAYEAIVAVIYLHNGMEGVELANEVMNFYA